MKPTTHQIAILREAVSVIKQHRDRFDMDTFFNTIDYNKPSGNPIHNCNTVACLGGWIVAIHADKMKQDIAFLSSTQMRANEILGMNPHSDETDKLFYPNYWPEEFGDYNYDSSWNDITPEILEARIEHYILTGE